MSIRAVPTLIFKLKLTLVDCVSGALAHVRHRQWKLKVLYLKEALKPIPAGTYLVELDSVLEVDHTECHSDVVRRAFEA